MNELEDEIKMVEETGGWIDPDIRKGPPVPTLLPSKGVGLFFQEGHLQFFILSEFNTSDTIIRTPISFKNAMKLLVNLWRTRATN